MFGFQSFDELSALLYLDQGDSKAGTQRVLEAMINPQMKEVLDIVDELLFLGKRRYLVGDTDMALDIYNVVLSIVENAVIK